MDLLVQNGSRCYMREERYTPSLEVSMHEHQWPYVCLVLQGGYAETGDKQIQTFAGSVHFYPAGSRHANRISDLATSEVYLTFRGWEGTLPSEMIEAKNPLVSLLLAKGRLELRRPDDLTPFVLDSYAAEVAGSFNVQIQESTAPRWLLRARDCLEDEFVRPPGLFELANGVGVDPSHLAKCFRATFGVTSGDYVRRRRLLKALDLIMDGCSFGQVAAHCGFADQSHFNRCFRSAFGCPPSEYAKLN